MVFSSKYRPSNCTSLHIYWSSVDCRNKPFIHARYCPNSVYVFSCDCFGFGLRNIKDFICFFIGLNIVLNVQSAKSHHITGISFIFFTLLGLRLDYSLSFRIVIWKIKSHSKFSCTSCHLDVLKRALLYANR